MNSFYNAKCLEEKEKYYVNIAEDLEEANLGQWYSKLKRMSWHDQLKNKEVEVMELMGKTVPEQVEMIADEFSAVSCEYEELKSENIDVQNALNLKEVPIERRNFSV